jgi:hypothetical protein
MKNKYGKRGEENIREEGKFHKVSGWLTDDEYEIRLR